MWPFDYFKSYDPNCDHEYAVIGEEVGGVEFQYEEDRLSLTLLKTKKCSECGAIGYEYERGAIKYHLTRVEEDLSSVSP